MYVFQKSAAKVEADQLKRKKWRELKLCWKRQKEKVSQGVLARFAEMMIFQGR